MSKPTPRPMATPTATVVLTLVLFLGAALTGCSDDGERGDEAEPDETESGLAIERLEEVAPSATDEDLGVFFAVEAVEIDEDTTTVELLVTNLGGDDVLLSDEEDPPLLLDTGGEPLRAPDDDVEITASSQERLVIPFAGVSDEPAELTLAFNTEFDNVYEPAVDIDGIRAEPGRRVEWVPPEAQGVALADRVVHHANGTSVVLNTIVAGPGTVEVTFLAVNGSDDFVRLADDRPYLQDRAGRFYPMLRGETNSELEIPGYQQLSGTMRFAGPLPPEAGELTLYLNDPTNDSDATSAPGFTFAGLDPRSS